MQQGFPEGARVARISGNEGMQQWPFWLDVQVMSLPLPANALNKAACCEANLHRTWYSRTTPTANSLFICNLSSYLSCTLKRACRCPQLLLRISAWQGDWKGEIRLELAVMLHQQTPEIMNFLAQLPDWTTSAGFTVYQKIFTF